MIETECVVIGAGVVGLAIAHALAKAGFETIVLEREPLIGSGVSSRNSEVIHAGFYYPTDLVKTNLCVRGNALLYSFCESRGIAHRRCGKLVVAGSADQAPALLALLNQGKANNVSGLRMLARAAAQAREPDVIVEEALLSETTGIVDSHGVMSALASELTDHGGILCLNSGVRAGRIKPDGIELDCEGCDEFSIRSKVAVINSAGLAAQQVAKSIAGLDERFIAPQFLAKGNYFKLNGRSPFQGLVYPIPVPGGLGIHATIDLDGRARFGPDVEWIETIDYSVDERRAGDFYKTIRTYWPGLSAGALSPDYCGIRPKIAKPGGSNVDFRIDTPELHGAERLINLFGIESPGLTSSLAIGEMIAGQVASWQ